jgi:hypothetical protein
MQTLINRHGNSSDISGTDLKMSSVFARYYTTQHAVSKYS